MRILIVKLSSLGDVIHTLPAARALKMAFPRAHLGWAVEKDHAAALKRQPWLDETIEWDRRGRRQFLPFLRRLRNHAWDAAIDFQGLFRSGLVVRASGARRRIGYSPSREKAHWFYTERVPLESLERHAVDRYLDLAAHVIGGREAIPAHPEFSLFPDEVDVRSVEAWLAERGYDAGRQQLVVLNPHCRKDANRWPAANYSHLAERLLEIAGVRVALTGGPAARALCDEIAAPLGDAVWRADGRFGILGSAELISRAQAFVTGDTGPMHIAAAMGTPIVALFGPANPVRTGPYAQNAIILNERLPCAPCYARRCPLQYDPPLCMERISIASVIAAVQTQLAARSARRKSA